MGHDYEYYCHLLGNAHIRHFKVEFTFHDGLIVEWLLIGAHRSNLNKIKNIAYNAMRHTPDQTGIR